MTRRTSLNTCIMVHLNLVSDFNCLCHLISRNQSCKRSLINIINLCKTKGGAILRIFRLNLVFAIALSLNNV